MRLTKGFATEDELRRHFLLHGREFGAETAAAYGELADRFMGEAWRSPVREKRTANDDLVRYDPTTDEFGRITAEGVIRTYFRVRRGRVGGLNYFGDQR